MLIFFVYIVLLLLPPNTYEYTLPSPVPHLWWWVWIEGSAGVDVEPGGKFNTYSSSTQPGGKAYFGFWFLPGAVNKIYLFGGKGPHGLYNDFYEKTFVEVDKVEEGETEWKYLNRWELLVDNKQTPNALNSDTYPGSRYGASTWLVGTTLFMFGGHGYGSAQREPPWETVTGLRWLRRKGYLQDLWKYSSLAKVWVKVGTGSEDIDKSENDGFWPGSRVDGLGNAVVENKYLYLYGGFGLCNTTSVTHSEGSFQYCNDRWRYDTEIDSWTRMGKHDLSNLEPSQTHAGARAGGQMFLSLSGNAMFLIGGSNGLDQNSVFRSYDFQSTWTFSSFSSLSKPLEGKYERKMEWTEEEAIPMGRRDFGTPMILENKFEEYFFFSGYSGFGWMKDFWKMKLNDTTFSWFLATGSAGDNSIAGHYFKERRNNFNKWSSPPQRRGFGSFVIGNKYLVIYGGFSDEQIGFKNDMWFSVDISLLISFYCAGRSRFDSSVCAGRGTCIAEDVCVCDEGYENVNGKCNIPEEEAEKKSDDSTVTPYTSASIAAGVLSLFNCCCCLFICCCIHIFTCLGMICCYVSETANAIYKKILNRLDPKRRREFMKKAGVKDEEDLEEGEKKKDSGFMKKAFAVMKYLKTYYEDWKIQRDAERDRENEERGGDASGSEGEGEGEDSLGVRSGSNSEEEEEEGEDEDEDEEYRRKQSKGGKKKRGELPDRPSNKQKKKGRKRGELPNRPDKDNNKKQKKLSGYKKRELPNRPNRRRKKDYSDSGSDGSGSTDSEDSY